jgi:ArsR family transcriptional regulator, arsenate/arsenite/antimonite-responsive transcriptional repressor
VPSTWPSARSRSCAKRTLSHHLKKLRAAGLVDSERRGLWAYYVLPDALHELTAWLG